MLGHLIMLDNRVLDRFSAWNAAVYVAQIEHERMTEALATTGYLDTTRGIARPARRAGSTMRTPSKNLAEEGQM